MLHRYIKPYLFETIVIHSYLRTKHNIDWTHAYKSKSIALKRKKIFYYYFHRHMMKYTKRVDMFMWKWIGNHDLYLIWIPQLIMIEKFDPQYKIIICLTLSVVLTLATILYCFRIYSANTEICIFTFLKSPLCYSSPLSQWKLRRMLLIKRKFRYFTNNVSDSEFRRALDSQIYCLI